MNKNWAGSNGVITLLAFMASAALLLSAYSFYTFRKQNLNLNNTVTLDAASSQLKVWNGNEWQNIGGAQPGQVLGIIDGKPGWIETSGDTSDSFTNTAFGTGLVRTGDKSAYTLSLANCNSGQALQSTGSSWECATITNPAPAPAPTYSAGNGINISGSNVISSTLGTSISTSELESGAVTSANLANDSVSSANIINGTILLADLNDNGCNPGQIFKFNGTNWVCASDNAGAGSYTFTVSDGTNVQTINDSDQLRFVSAGTLSIIVSASDTVTLDVANNAITTGKILDGTIGFADIGANGCANGQTIKFNGTTWTCGTDNVNDADASATNELQNLSLAVNVLSISGGNSVNLAPYLDNTDSQNLSYASGTQLLSISGGNTISLANLLDNTDSQSIGKTGNTLSITGSAGTVDLSGYLDNTDILASLSCSNGQVAQWNGSAWICANAGADTDDQTLSLIANTLSISEGNSVSLAGYLDNTDAQAITKTGNTLSISGNVSTVDLSGYLDNTDSQNLSYVAGTQTLSIGGGNSVSLSSLLDNTDSQAISKSGDIISITGSAGTVDLSGYLDNTDAQSISKTGNTLSITGSAGTVDLSGYLDNTDVLAGLSCGTNQIAKYNGSAWVCAADNVNDADASPTNELQDLSLSVNVLSLSGSAATINLAGYLDNTDSQTVTYTPATQVLSISGGNTANLSSLLDNTDSQAISKTGNTLSISGNASTVDLSGYLDNTDVLGSLSCSNTQIAKYNGSAWVCAADNDTTYSAGTGISLVGTTFSATLGTSIDSSEIVDGSILFADLSANSCTNGQIFKYNGSSWVCGTDNVNDADASATNELQDLSLSVNILSLSGSAATVNLAPYLDNTDSQNLSYVAGTQALSIGGGNSVSLASLLDNTDSQGISKTGNTLSITGSAGTVDLSSYLDNTDAQSISKTGNTLSITGSAGTVDLSGYLDNTDVLAGLSCGTNQIAKYNGSAWVCAADNDTTYSAGTGISIGATVISATLGTDIDSSEIVNGTIADADIANATITNSKLTNSSVTVTAGTGLTGGGAVSLGGTVTLNSSLGTAIDTSEITDGTILFGDFASNGCGTNAVIKYNGSAWVCGTDLTGGSVNSFETIATTGGTNPAADSSTDTLTLTAGTGVTVVGDGTTDTVTFAAVLGVDIDSSEIVDGTITNTDIANGTIANAKLANSSVTVTAGTGLTGGGAVSLGGTVTLNSSLGTAIDTSEITDGTLLFADIASNGCGTNAIFKYNGSAWICGTDVDTDTTYSAGTGISFGGTVISSTLGTDITSSEIVDGTIAATDVTGNTFAQLGVATAQTDSSTNGLLFINKTGASGNLLQLQVAGVNRFLVAFDGTIDTASVDSASIVDNSVANGDLANSSLTVTAGTGLTGGGAVSLGGTVTLNNAFGTSIDNTEVTADALDFTEIKDTLALDATTTIAAGANNFVLNLDGTGDFLVQDNGTTVLSVLDDGTLLFKNSTDSASSFVIQDSAGIDLFSIDTANDRVYIGDPTSDTTGSLLVLDTKSGAGDPTGVNGAMYYNGASNKSRCYEAGAWQDCISRYRVRLAADVTNNNAVANTMADVTGLSFNVTSGIGYQFECNIWYTAAATTTGSRWSINGPTTTNLSYTSLYTLTATTNTSNTAVAYNIPAASNASSGYTTGNTANIRGYITPSANGTVIVRFASEIANSAIVAKAGSSCEYWVP